MFLQEGQGYGLASVCQKTATDAYFLEHLIVFMVKCKTQSDLQ